MKILLLLLSLLERTRSLVPRHCLLPRHPKVTVDLIQDQTKPEKTEIRRGGGAMVAE